jgi:hypothetical protein
MKHAHLLKGHKHHPFLQRLNQRTVHLWVEITAIGALIRFFHNQPAVATVFHDRLAAALMAR